MKDSGTPPAADRRSDSTGPAYWNDVWRGSHAASAAPFSYYYRTLLRELLALCAPGSTALELGCGGSVWLPTLARHGVDAWGIDYADVGIAKVRGILARWGAHATVVQGDLFDPALLPPGHFDLVYSLGLLEHFADSRGYVSRLRALVKPGGHVLTTVPNLAGRWGRVQAALDRSVFESHRLYSPTELDLAHTAAGLEVARPARYFGGICPLIVEYDPVLRRLPRWAARGVMAGLWAGQQTLGWSMAVLPHRVSNPPTLAGHILGVYRRPA